MPWRMAWSMQWFPLLISAYTLSRGYESWRRARYGEQMEVIKGLNVELRFLLDSRYVLLGS
jgi:hypothetical protein